MARKRGKSPKYPSHLVIPDTQARADAPTSHLEAAGRYALAKRPDTIIHLGDCGDFPSLSSYDSAAAKGFDQRDFKEDCDAANECARLLVEPIAEWNRTHRKPKQYHPRLVMLEGNHDGQTGNGRIARAVRDQPWLRGALLDQVRYADYGWEVVPFLQPIIIDDVGYCHYYCRNARGAVVQTRRGMPSAHQQVVREGMSATAGHLQGLQVHIQQIGSGARRRGIIAGSFYQGEFATDYLSPQGHDYWKGILVCHELRNGGDYDLVECSLGFLMRRYT